MFDEKKLYLFDLDGTLLGSDKTIPEGALAVLGEYRRAGVMIGVSTSRSAENSAQYTGRLVPDVIIASGGATVELRGEKIFESAVEAAQVRELVRYAKSVVGGDVNITLDAADGSYYLNFVMPDDVLTRSFRRGRKITFRNFRKSALKICLEIADAGKAREVIGHFPQLDAIKFSDGDWYKFTNHGITKEHAIDVLCESLYLPSEQIVAFGDDLADIGMLQCCGRGIAMGNAEPEVKRIADEVIGGNDERGIEIFLRTERVRRMEELFNLAKAGKASKAQIDVLKNYLNDGFLGDYEADEEGMFPRDMLRGVLSQDALYDLLEEL